MISIEMRGLIDRGKAEDLKLFRTKRCLQMFRDARGRWPQELIDELWRLAEAMAIAEWGVGTVLDDFSIEGKVVIVNLKRRMEI